MSSMDCEAMTAEAHDEAQREAQMLLCVKITTGNYSEEGFFDFCCTNSIVKQGCDEIIGAESLDCVVKHAFSFPHYDTYTFLLMALCIPLGLVSNTLLVRLVNKSTRMTTRSGYFVRSLACCNLLVMASFVMYVVCQRYDLGEALDNYMTPSIEMSLATLTLLHSLLISIERAVAVMKPTFFFSKKFSRYTIASIWTSAVIVLALALSRVAIETMGYRNFVLCSFIALLIACVITVTICYSSVCVMALRRFACLRVSAGSSPTPCRMKKLGVAFSTAVLVFPTVCILALIAAVQLHERISGSRVDDVENWFMICMPFVASSLSPVAYICLTRSLRQGVRKIFQKSPSQSLPVTTSGSETKLFDTSLQQCASYVNSV